MSQWLYLSGQDEKKVNLFMKSESGVRLFGQWIVNEDWSDLDLEDPIMQVSSSV